MEVRSESPVPIFDESKRLLGFAVMSVESGLAVATCAMDRATPERLDIESASRNYWMDADVEYRGFVNDPPPARSRSATVVYVKALYLKSQLVDGQTPVRGIE
jgi:hypothetical protein